MPHEQLVIRQDTARITTTPNATMTTLASPTLSGAQELSLWRTQMTAGARGPLHRFTQEQVWNLIEGRASITIDGVDYDLEVGDAITIAAQVERQVHALTDCRFIVVSRAATAVSVPGEEADRPVPAWIV